jgi:hypothetical protein
MRLVRTEEEYQGYRKRTFECTACDGSMTEWARYKGRQSDNSGGMLFQNILTLVPAKCYFGSGDQNDYCVLDGGRVIGRIFMPLRAPVDQPWFWMITAGEKATCIGSRGCSATCDQAVQDFKAQWVVQST